MHYEWDRDLRPSKARLPRFIATSRLGPIEDMPWGFASQQHVVSDRFKSFLEEHAPGQVHFSPITILYRRKRCTSTRYWVTHWTHEVECHDEHRTLFNDFKRADGSRSIFHLAVDLRRVPSNVLVFCPKWHKSVLIRRSLMLAIEASGMTGQQFMSVECTHWAPD